jgi:hypothetical protein
LERGDEEFWEESLLMLAMVVSEGLFRSDRIVDWACFEEE